MVKYEIKYLGKPRKVSSLGKGQINTVVIVQARMGSTRFPGKSLKKINGKTLIGILFDFLKLSDQINSLVLATTLEAKDDELASEASDIGWIVFRGSEKDVLGRFYQAAKSFQLNNNDIIVRITGDDIFPDISILDALLVDFKRVSEHYVFASSNFVERLPYGSDFEMFNFEALVAADSKAQKSFDREHVTPYIKDNLDEFPAVSFEFEEDATDCSVSIDFPEDLQVAEGLYNHLQCCYSQREILQETIKFLRNRNLAK